MIPWPIALLSVFYALIATSAAAQCYKIALGALDKPLAPQVAWLLVAGGAMIGLPMRRVWGRWCAIACAWWMTFTVLAIAAWLISQREPGWGLVAGLGTVVPLVAARYLTRPKVKSWFTDKVPSTS